MRSSEPHPQVRALLDTIEAQNIPPTYALSVEAARAQFEEFFSTPDSEPVGDVREVTIAGPGGDLPLRLYYPEGEGPHPALVYFHGGGWTVGSLDSYDDVTRGLTNAADCIVVSVDYRLAPDHPFPAAVEDAYAATEWVTAHGGRVGIDTDRVAVGGDSAGGNLTAAVTLAARDRDGPELCHQSLIYPAVNSPVHETFDSYEAFAEGYLLERRSIKWYYDNYIQNETDARNEYAAPLLARDLSGLPPATLITGGFDPLHDEGVAYAERLSEAGVPVEHTNYEDMIHAFVSLASMVDRGREAIERVGAELDSAFGR